MANRYTAYQTLNKILCQYIKFESALQIEDLNWLQLFLERPDHKIVGLDMTSHRFKQSEINKVINILSHPNINNSRIDVINLGQRKFYEKDLISMGKWILNKFSARVDENIFDVRKYLFSLKEVQTEDSKSSAETPNRRSEELRETFQSRHTKSIDFRLNYETNELQQTRRGNMTQIVMDIDRHLTSDSYKILYLVYDYCEKFVELKISNRKHMKEPNFDNRK